MTVNREVISIVKVENLDEIYEKIREGFDLIGNPKFKPTDVVAIKPNLCCIKGPETGATTDLRVVEALVKYLQEEFQVSDITIIESDGKQVLADMAFKLLGYERLSERLNVKIANLSKSPWSYKTFDHNVRLKKVRFPEILAKANWLISVPKIKAHTLCTIGGTMKNQFGCNPNPPKSIYHRRLHDCIVDLNVAFRPNLVVVDGIVAMEGRGPVHGLPVRLNALIFGRDSLAVDYLIARIIGENPDHIEYLAKARKRGIGTAFYETVGISPKEISGKFGDAPGRHNLYGLFSDGL